jgi:hypothetical protein
MRLARTVGPFWVSRPPRSHPSHRRLTTAGKEAPAAPRPLVAEHGCGDPRARGQTGDRSGTEAPPSPSSSGVQTGRRETPPRVQKPPAHSRRIGPRTRHDSRPSPGLSLVPHRRSADTSRATPDAMERRRREPNSSPGPKARALQPTPSPSRSPAPARQPALAPGLSLVPHGCGDPLIRLVQAPQLNRVLEGWCAICTRQKPPRAFERPGARAGCRAGPGDRSSKSPPASRAREFPKRGLARL